MTTHWILVVGTGRQTGLATHVAALAEAFGEALAEREYGLVVGGWPGVDYLVSKGFAKGIAERGLSLSNYLIQVNAEQRPMTYPQNADYPDFKGGHIVTVPTGAREWIEALKYADAVLLLGGEGGTKETYFYATQEQRPVFPVLYTDGDAQEVYSDLQERWELFPYQGYTKEQFIKALSQPIGNHDERVRLVTETLDLLHRQFAYSERDEKRELVFLSYARKDRTWLVELRNSLRPLERNAGVTIWDDSGIPPGEDFEQTIGSQIRKARVAVLLVSDAFCQSEFIMQKELPLLLQRRNENKLIILWVLLAGTDYQHTPISKLHTIIDPKMPLASLPSAQRQDALVNVRRELATMLAS